jgi:hypothetical protein
MNPKPSRSLRRRVLYLLAAVIFLTLLAFGGSVTYFIYLSERQTWQGRQSEVAHSAATTIQTFLAQAKISLQTVGMLEPDYVRTHPAVLRIRATARSSPEPGCL